MHDIIELAQNVIATAIITALLQLRDAKRVCVSCTVQSLCLEWALLAGIDHGVWGGLSEDAPNTQHPRHWRDAAGGRQRRSSRAA